MPIAPILPASPGKFPLSDYKPLANEELASRIEKARDQLGSKLLILGHHYQQDEVIAHSDLRGDSYQLSKLAADSVDCRHIIFCGVHFMAETADMLPKRPPLRSRGRIGVLPLVKWRGKQSGVHAAT